ncbi:MAG: ABC transporter permease, partial [Streptococcus mutans]
MKKIGHLYLTLVFLILYIPIFYLIFYSFNQAGDMNRFTGLTLEHYTT